MKLFLIAAVCLAAAVSAEPEADAYYGYGYGHQLHWPGAAGPGFSATCWGCRPYGYHGHYLGKRSAEPEPYYGYGYYGHPYGAYGYGPFYGHLRAAIPTAAGPTGVAGHPTGTSYVAHGVPLGARGKRSAEPHGYFYGHPFAYRGFGYGIAGHPGAATSFVQNSPWGLGK